MLYFLSVLKQPESRMLMSEQEHDLQEVGSLFWQGGICSHIDLAEVRSWNSSSSNTEVCISLYTAPSTQL